MESIEDYSKINSNLVFNSNIINKKFNKLHSNILNKSNLYKEFSSEKKRIQLKKNLHLTHLHFLIFQI